ncbi:MAG: iron complex transport system permease protein [Candidatus Ordinivivax streblomastigis]|uniref:Iron complex transport system permease protein n=1 Tax=Candidatus Ordinivivax streblomastigis TaxID=2540710 RepID=A0A5M8P046_9BACT|nr:MAG: iron complex transport system permease protein [Candidatus Ordinivivax streblomastigis]
MKRYTTDALWLIALFVLLVLVTLVSFSLGRYPIAVSELLDYLFTGSFADENIPILISQVRMPRIIGAILAGGGLAISGAAYQGLFRNPMVSPDLLGVSSGAGFGAALAIILSMGILGIQMMAFVTGVGAVLFTLFVSRIIGQNHDKILMLVLSGMVVGSLFSALLSLMKYIADSESKLPDITFWLMGSLAEVSLKELTVVAPVVLLALIPLLLTSWKLNVLSFGDGEASTMGVNTRQLRLTVIGCASLITASIVCITGLIGWVGLIIPHIARFMVGANHRILLPASFLLGASFMLIIDDLARTVSTLEIPLGIITSLIGAPLFLFLLKFSSKKVW